MAPVLHDNHWWCYALDWESKKLFVLDSLEHKCPRRKQIDNHIVSIVMLLSLQNSFIISLGN